MPEEVGYRWDVLNRLIARFSYTTYLEIGFGVGDTFSRIHVPDKVCVDPHVEQATHQMYSDSFFEKNEKKYDLVFVDGDHRHEQVLKDIINALSVLEEGGTVVVHDCSPPREECQAPNWYGTGWRAWLALRVTREDLEMFTVDTLDGSCGIIRKGKQELFPKFSFLDENRDSVLNSKPTAYLDGEVHHLLYSVYASKKSREWISNIEKLCEYSNCFNGRRVVVIRSDTNTVAPEEVERLFTFPVEYVRIQNTELHETEKFVEVLSTYMQGRFAAEGFLFYAHTKGVKHKEGSAELKLARVWRDHMYSRCLSNLGEVDSVLKEYGCAGCFCIGSGVSSVAMPNSTWHYSGNFWWVNLKELQKRNWNFIYPHTHGVEAYLGSIFKQSEAYNMTPELGGPGALL